METLLWLLVPEGDKRGLGLSTTRKYHLSLSLSVSLCVPLHLGEGNGYPFQYSCLENPMDREA